MGKFLVDINFFLPSFCWKAKNVDFSMDKVTWSTMEIRKIRKCKRKFVFKRVSTISLFSIQKKTFSNNCKNTNATKPTIPTNNNHNPSLAALYFYRNYVPEVFVTLAVKWGIKNNHTLQLKPQNYIFICECYPFCLA